MPLESQLLPLEYAVLVLLLRKFANMDNRTLFHFPRISPKGLARTHARFLRESLFFHELLAEAAIAGR